ncbi:MAG: flagellar protein FlgN [Spirochaetaceae bacterium]|jgi:hypothetical protein|nr:flagellar protein FlgN [Spirochaetaceae bacterium]
MPFTPTIFDVLTEEEVARRVAILKRFRQLLAEQRDRFHSYLNSLDIQKKVIERGSVDELSAHVELEEKIIADIFSIQKSIEPMKTLYESAWAGVDTPEVPELNAALDKLRLEAARRANENKELLQKRMATLRGELKTLRANPFQRRARTLHAENTQATLLDIKG